MMRTASRVLVASLPVCALLTGIAQPASAATAATCGSTAVNRSSAYSQCTPFVILSQHRVVITCGTGPTSRTAYGDWKNYGTRSHKTCPIGFLTGHRHQTRSSTCSLPDSGIGNDAARDESVAC